MRERRVYPRHKADLDVEYGVENTVSIEAKTKTVNISEGGLLMPLNKAIKPGKKIELKIKLPDGGGEMKAIGKVMWKKSLGNNLPDEEDAGVKFIGLYENSSDVLTGYLQTISGAT